jgi:hypothetical protein
MAARKTAPKALDASLGYDSFMWGDEVRRFESPPVAKLEFRDALTAAKKKKVVTDTTPSPDARWGELAKNAAQLQLQWADDKVSSAWFTAHEIPKGKSAWDLLSIALDLPVFADLFQIGIGLHQWNDSHRAKYDSVVDVLAAKKPKITALAFGDFVNESGHSLQFENLARVAELYPKLTSLRVTTGRLPPLGSLALAELRSVFARGMWGDAAAQATFARAWPSLEKLGIGWTRSSGSEPAETVADWQWLLERTKTPRLTDLTLGGSTIWEPLLAALLRSPLLPQLRRLDLRSAADPERDIFAALKGHAKELEHLEALVLPNTVNSALFEGTNVRVRYARDRSQPVHRD